MVGSEQSAVPLTPPAPPPLRTHRSAVPLTPPAPPSQYPQVCSTSDPTSPPPLRTTGLWVLIGQQAGRLLLPYVFHAGTLPVPLSARSLGNCPMTVSTGALPMQARVMDVPARLLRPQLSPGR